MTHIGPYELNSIITGNSQELCAALPDESVGLILTDPDYNKLEDYRWLGELAMRVLKPNSACLAWVSANRQYECKALMQESGLNFSWPFHYITPASQKMLHLYGIISCVTPCLIFTKGRRKASPYLLDYMETRGKAEDGFAWQKNTKVLSKLLRVYSKPGDLVLDCFAGVGSLPVACKLNNRNFIAFELDAKRAEKGRRRVAATVAINRTFNFKPMKQRKLEEMMA